MEDLSIMRAGKTVDFAALAVEALKKGATDQIFVQNSSLFVEICGRWIASGADTEAKIAAFGRILPFAPHLAEHVERFLENKSQSRVFRALHSQLPEEPFEESTEDILCEHLLGIFRLLSFDCRSFERFARPLALQSLFHHRERSVRYLAVLTFCLCVHAADNATQEMIKRYIGEGEVSGPWEGQCIDYRFLSLWEEKRWNDLDRKFTLSRAEEAASLIPPNQDHGLSPYTVNVSGVLLPRLDGAPSQVSPLHVISTSTTESNLRNIARGLLSPSPLLLTGLAGSGKTLLARHFAWQLNKLETMVTLHLNEQSDAKLLVGMYATGTKPGTFSWRPGVLTTAVKEGRWIFIEDLDRAPNEVISTLLPLIERRDLLIPNRGETVRAARGFRIIATMRSTLNAKGHEILPRQNMIGHRFWNSIHVRMPKLEEFERVVTVKYPVLHKHASGIMNVYSRLLDLYSDAKFSSENGTSIRAITPRDLLKWCDRIAVLLAQASSFSSAQIDDIFMEAFDCFAGSLASEGSRLKVMTCVAEELHIDPQRRDHLLQGRQVKLDILAQSTASGPIRIGRITLARQKSSKRLVTARPFSTNDYTLRLLEKVAVAVDRREPLLLVGETGTGKTTSIQYLAEQLGRKLVAFNLSQQSESGDLLGGYKPINVRSLIVPLKDEFDDLFDATFSRKKNQRFIEMLGKRMARGEWKRVCMLWREALKMVDAARKAHESQTSSPDPEGGQPKKRRKMDTLPADFPKARWEKFSTDLHDLEAQLANGSEAFAFSFLEGNIVKAVRNGDWVLLDEINLASSDTLEALADLLGAGPDGTPSVLLTETGNVERVVAHPHFRVFAAMNPATDVGKKDLPPGIRSRFTEIYVESPDTDRKSLQSIVEKYLGGDGSDPTIVKVAADVTRLYLKIQELAKANMLVDGADQKAHFSLRTLTRTLTYAREIAPLCSLRRALYEGFHMSFLTFLGKSSDDLVAPIIRDYLFREKPVLKAELGKPLLQPSDGRKYVRQGHYWLRQGAHVVEEQPHYIITPFVQRNMNNLIRAASTRRYPVLIQGPTSSGKTSMIEYLAKRSGNKFVRINNHEHTDLQEYLGSYISGDDGKLVFQEGILVRALREGHWIVLDELNLAPTDVLEALNRLLDDNRELLIPETQEVIRPHEDFMLFATQNPAGLYGGRKVLSRAFRNRFLELHFDDIPIDELTEILHRRTRIPESWCKRIVNVYQELSTLRQENRLFEQKSFATLRDLFRWAQRKADTIQDLANNGYMLLAERVRKEEERVAVKKVIETVMSRKGPRVTVDEELMFSEEASPEIRLWKEKSSATSGVVWTRAMRRLFVLVAHAVRNDEPVLLVGDTGCGKTTVCQMLADAFGKNLYIVNAHQNTETGDLIGAQRPIRNRGAIEELLREHLLQALGLDKTINTELSTLLEMYDKLDVSGRESIPEALHSEIQTDRIKATALFEWADGSLVHAMRTGQLFLLDEISLADDSVLERLNSVLEPSRTLLLAEKGPVDSVVTASDGFQFLATMNPGGDYGKKELSPALRNRFTEIWVPALSDVEDILQIVCAKLKPTAVQFAGCIVSFAQWFNDKFNTSVASSISIRDTLAWVSFINSSSNSDLTFSVVHGAAMVYIDTLGANPAGLLAIAPSAIVEERRACLQHLSKLLGTDVSSLYFGKVELVATAHTLELGAFSVHKVSPTTDTNVTFSFDAPTTRSNAMRVIRALQLSKPILLEGNPGVGKTTLVTALARAIGKPLTRLNLSEQTDLMDLFGSDVPVERGQAGTFAWRDAPFLKAMKEGDWVLLDEMNLASQSVLEGLNAVLDHRGEVYVSELDQTFHKHQDFRVFAAQNPHHQGGGRKGLPASFVNRFTVVYADVFGPEDLSLICSRLFPSIDSAEVEKLISFVAQLETQVVHHRAFGTLGAPWEFNLRDTLRWLELLDSPNMPGSARDFLDAIFVQRFRTESDRVHLLKLFREAYGAHEPRITLYHDLTPKSMQIGVSVLSRNASISRPEHVSHLWTAQLEPMEALMISVQQNWPVILVGPPGSGKTGLVNQMASFLGAGLVTFSMNADVDAMDLVGGYEQVDPSRELHSLLSRVDDFLRHALVSSERLLKEYSQALELLSKRSETVLPDIVSLLYTIARENIESRPASVLAKQLQQLIQTSQQIDAARFQWVDGILVQALEQGKWLVLDNANLCSSAVLDRLNSLLEPKGYLNINEHSTADGEARIVKPHPNFRIFMTMDPRFGELSRAMRNRSVEICLIPKAEDARVPKTQLPLYPLESRMYRFRHLCDEARGFHDTVEPRFENLSTADTGLLQGFVAQASRGLVHFGGLNSYSVDVLKPTSFLKTYQPDAKPEDGMHKYDRLSAFLRSTWAPQVLMLQTRCSLASGALLNKFCSLPFHPCNNESLLKRSDALKALCARYASFYDVWLELSQIQHAIQALPSVKFERRREKRALPQFLFALGEDLTTYMTAVMQDENQTLNYHSLKVLLQLFRAFAELAAGSNFDRATFHTYLKMLNDCIAGHPGASSVSFSKLARSVSTRLAVFRSDVHLTTGLGMERIWRHFRPDTPKTQSQLSAILILEELADRLDAVTWKTSLKLDEMVQVRERFSSALDLVRKQEVEIDDFIRNLHFAVHELENSVSENAVAFTPHFKDEFEGLCQFLDITRSNGDITTEITQGTAPSATLSLVHARSTLLAQRPTKTLVTEYKGAPWEHFARLYSFAGMERSPAKALVLQGSFHTSLLLKLRSADEVQLAQFDLFQTELGILAQQIVLDADRVTQDQRSALASVYDDLLGHIRSSHSDIISNMPSDLTVKIDRNAPISEQYLLALEQPLNRCFEYLSHYRPTDAHAPPTQIDAQAWIDLGLMGLALYIPNYPHDPALQPMVERRLFHQERSGLSSKLECLRGFQVRFTGQDTSYRIREAENTLLKLGEEPPVPSIVRPVVSELDALQGEFSNLLSIIRPLASKSIDIPEATQDETLRQNISQIIRRLAEGYRSYDDITSPAVGFLVCLDIGLALYAQEKESHSNVSRSLEYLVHRTPFFGMHEWNLAAHSEVLLRSCEQELAQKSHAADLRWHILHCLAVIKIVDSGFMVQERTADLIHDIFSSFYGEWKKRLLQEQEKEVKNISLYTYRGEENNAEEEDPELFPDYEKDQGHQTAGASTSREHAVCVADMHAKIFGDDGSASEAMIALLNWCAYEMQRISEGKAHGTKHQSAFPAIYLALAEKTDAISSSGAGRNYNFYFDANPAEAQRLVALVHRVQHRYRQIRKIWPEHAALWDVLRTCDEVLEFRHVDPVAKLITKAEKLHAFMYEWQRVASREYSTTNLFDDLTKLLVSWRQLELTTWARLFDMETEKCHCDAKSWFFVAYETIVAAAESIENEKAMRMYACELLKTLESFFISTTLGQYEGRLTLLLQFRQHVGMLLSGRSSLKPLYVALGNFIAYFSRLQKPVQEALAKGRLSLEKEVKDVIQLATWRDTNIEALKQSAKMSHRKLSKLVRKFRNLLNQPVSGLVKAGFPEEGVLVREVHMKEASTIISFTALELCMAKIPGWIERPSRFQNLPVTISMMRKMSTPSADSLDGATYIQSFIADLESSITQLQKATPTKLTDENKETVQHLKTRKRKLYADTMKELRQMGINSNLSSDVLAKQDELSTVLVGLPLVAVNDNELGRGAENFLHKSLSIMSQVRDVSREHSGDLTSNDVARSIGYLEGLLHANVRQRGVLSSASKILETIRSVTAKIAAFSASEGFAVSRLTEGQLDASVSLPSSLLWLCAMLDVGVKVVTAQAKLGQTNDVNSVIHTLREWSIRLRQLADDYRTLPKLPNGIWSNEHKQHDAGVRKQLSDFSEAFKALLDKYPISRSVLKQIQPFVLNYPDIKEDQILDDMRVTIESHEIFFVLDLILGGMQDVESALKRLPTSTDDAAWLVKEEQILAAAIDALHATRVSRALDTIQAKLRYLREDGHLQAIAAIFATVRPIMDQYTASLEFLVQRFDTLHCASSKLLHRLSKSFLQVGTQGFCQPSDKSAEQQPGKDDKLESGTGLGEGEGAEDISKDIEDDEDLEDLAQEKNGDREGSIEEEEDAVNMGEQEMDGETGEAAEKEDQGSDAEEGEDDAKSEVGSVDDLGPSAVDEKMWDEGVKEDEPEDKEGKQDVGTEKKDKQAASDQEEKQENDGAEEKGDEEAGGEDEDTEMEGEEQDENVSKAEAEQVDPHAKEEETLDLPDELNMDGGEDDKDDEDLGDMDMDDNAEEEETETGAEAELDSMDEEFGPEHEAEEKKDTTEHVEDDQKMEQEGEEDPVEDDFVPLPDQNAPEDDGSNEKKDNAESDPNAEAGAGADANEEAHKNQKEQASASAAIRDEGAEGDSVENKQETAAEDGVIGQTSRLDTGGHGEQPEESPETQSFKKLGDLLERWYNQQKQISEARQKDETQLQQIDKEVNMADADFEHLPDENTQADTQALGTTTEEQAKALDQDMAMAVDEDEKMPARPEDQDEELWNGDQDVDMADTEPTREQEQQQPPTTDGRPEAFIGEKMPFTHPEDQDMEDSMPLNEDISETSSVEDVETQLELTHLGPSAPVSAEDARSLWLSHEAATHSLSQQLTEHLRLILAPTLATKLRGDFRTGKRLNLKRIIPYIASGYKRDKIWLRRSQPSKRSYQVLIALDDSKSMSESGASHLALKTLTLVTRSLSMLEVGEVAVVGFGDAVNVAHDFDKPFTSDAGVRVFEQFGFEATRTNVRGLVERSLELFGEARRRAGSSSSAGEELWQLMLVVSDGICDSHAEIQRLVRRAQEERVMVVFVIIDGTAAPASPAGGSRPAPSGAAGADAAKGDVAAVQAKEKTSILDLQSVEISKEGKVVRWKYMERFPFKYYLVVRDVRELPGVLAGALRQWFGEVAGSA